MPELDQYDYDLPRDLIAQHPAEHRVDARLMVVNRRTAEIQHQHVRDLPGLLRADDCLVLNDTKVIPARLVGRRTATGGQWEGLFLAGDENDAWKILSKSRGKIQPGETVTLTGMDGRDDAELIMIERLGGGQWLARSRPAEPTLQLLERVGRVPLPHYIRDGEMLPEDRERYQTVYARHRGSVAAPTAGLHFTAELFDEIRARQVDLAWVTLHVGLDTFRPVKTDRLQDHEMHCEWARLEESTANSVGRCRRAGGRCVAVGTTTVRVLETAVRDGEIGPWSGTTDLFIRPPFPFRAVDALMTNFHLPRTTLLVLACCFGGHELIMRAYRQAVCESYRFYSYGDAMLIV